jgi:mannose-6-phosphate isomerase-like protein (cupin superfamily)
VLEIDGLQRELRESQGIEVPPRVAHQFRNDSHADVVFVVASRPIAHEDRVNL